MFQALTRRWLPRAVQQKLAIAAQVVSYPPDLSDDDVALVEFVAPYTMTTPERIVALAEAVHYVVAHGVPGAVVECGVWRGGSMMVVARTLAALGHTDRQLVLCDTFEGMTAPTDDDRDLYGTAAAAVLGQRPAAPRASAKSRANKWCIASVDDVSANVASTGYPMERVQIVVGPVEDTLPAAAPDQIALLRLDTDWYASTRHEMETLYPRLVPGGVLVVDDYGHWEGSRRAVDEYFAAHPPRPLLLRVDYTCRLGLKP